MPNDKDSRSDRPEHGGGRALSNLVLLTLPWLSFQRDMLTVMKKGIEDASHVRPFENLILLELQALMMIFDPSGKWRSYIDSDLQQKMEEAYKKTFPQLVSTSILSIEAQEAALASLAELLNKLRKDGKPSGGPSKNTTDQSER
jgi:hypothetical protein